MGMLSALRQIVRKNSAGSDYERRRLNLIEGSNVTITVSDDAANDEIDVTIAASGGGGGSDPLVAYKTYAFEQDDFVGGVTSAIGKLSWLHNNGTLSYINDEADHPGIWRSVTTVANQAVTLSLSGVTTGGPLDPAKVGWKLLFVVRANVIDAEVVYRIGAQDANNGTPGNDGIYLERLQTDTNWFLVIRANSSQTRVDTGVAASTDWITALLRRIDASTIGVSINGGTEVTSTATAPTVHLAPIRQVTYISGGTLGNKSFDIDYFYFYNPVTRT